MWVQNMWTLCLSPTLDNSQLFLFLLVEFTGLVIEILFTNVGIAEQTPVDALSKSLLLSHSQNHDNRKVPDAGPEQTSSCSLVSPSPPELPSLERHPAIDSTARDYEAPVCDATVGQTDANGKHQYRISQCDAAVHSGVHPCCHAIASVLVLVAYSPAERIEVGKLPGV